MAPTKYTISALFCVFLLTSHLLCAEAFFHSNDGKRGISPKVQHEVPFSIHLSDFPGAHLGALSQDAKVKILHKLPAEFYGIDKIQLQDEVEDSWRVKVTFSKPVKSFLVWRASVETIFEDKRSFIPKNKTWNSEMPAGRLFRFRFLGKKMRFVKKVPKMTATFFRLGGESGSTWR